MTIKTFGLTLLALLSLALQGCAQEPKVIYFGPGEQSDSAICGSPPSASDIASEFEIAGQFDRRVRAGLGPRGIEGICGQSCPGGSMDARSGIC